MLERLKGNRRKALLVSISFLEGFVLLYYAVHQASCWSPEDLNIIYFILPFLLMKLAVRSYYYFFVEESIPENRKKERLVIALDVLMIGSLLMVLYVETIEINSLLRNFVVFLIIACEIVYLISEYIESKILN